MAQVWKKCTNCGSARQEIVTNVHADVARIDYDRCPNCTPKDFAPAYLQTPVGYFDADGKFVAWDRASGRRIRLAQLGQPSGPISRALPTDKPEPPTPVAQSLGDVAARVVAGLAFDPAALPLRGHVSPRPPETFEPATPAGATQPHPVGKPVERVTIQLGVDAGPVKAAVDKFAEDFARLTVERDEWRELAERSSDELAIARSYGEREKVRADSNYLAFCDEQRKAVDLANKLAKVIAERNALEKLRVEVFEIVNKG